MRGLFGKTPDTLARAGSATSTRRDAHQARRDPRPHRGYVGYVVIAAIRGQAPGRPDEGYDKPETS